MLSHSEVNSKATSRDHSSNSTVDIYDIFFKTQPKIVQEKEVDFKMNLNKLGRIFKPTLFHKCLIFLLLKNCENKYITYVYNTIPECPPDGDHSYKLEILSTDVTYLLIGF